MDREVTIKIIPKHTIPAGYPMTGKVYESLTIQGFKNGKKSFGGISHNIDTAAKWVLNFLNEGVS
jgi:hypothetical protein